MIKCNVNVNGNFFCFLFPYFWKVFSISMWKSVGRQVHGSFSKAFVLIQRNNEQKNNRMDFPMTILLNRVCWWLPLNCNLEVKPNLPEINLLARRPNGVQANLAPCLNLTRAECRLSDDVRTSLLTRLHGNCGTYWFVDKTAMIMSACQRASLFR